MLWAKFAMLASGWVSSCARVLDSSPRIDSREKMLGLLLLGRMRACAASRSASAFAQCPVRAAT